MNTKLELRYLRLVFNSVRISGLVDHGPLWRFTLRVSYTTGRDIFSGAVKLPGVSGSKSA